jgi:curved DNA-binding protein CbpA
MGKSFNLYDILGVERDATDAEIKSAFRKLTLQHHPDRFTGDRRNEAEERFQGITEAFNVLSRRESRDKYDQELSMGQNNPKTMDQSEIARRLASKGANTLREGRVTDAISELQSAINHDQECARAHYFLGIALGRIKGREKDALRSLERSVQIEPGNAVMLTETAAFALKVGMKARARRFAEQALNFDPTNEKAALVLKNSDDTEPAQAPQGEGLFARLRRGGG